MITAMSPIPCVFQAPWWGNRNFGTLEVTGPRKERVMTIRTHDAKGDIIWEREYKASDL